MNQIYKKFQKDIYAIVYFGAAVFVFLSLASFNPQDPSFNTLGNGLIATNYCGIMGSFLADLLYQFFGISAWLLGLGLILISYANYKGENYNFKNIKTIIGVLIVLDFAALGGVYFPKTMLYSGQIYLSGLIGLAVAKTFLTAFNFVGVQIILWSLMSLFIVFYFEKNLQELTEYPKKIVDFVLDKIKNFKKISYFNSSNVKINIKTNKSVESQTGYQEFIIDNSKNSKSSKKIETNLNSETENNFDELDSESNFEVEDEDEDFDQEIQKNSFEMDESEAVASAGKRKVIIKAKIPKRVANWQMPKISLLEDPPATRIKVDEKEIRRKAEVLTEKLGQFSIGGQVTAVKPGPAVTMFEFKPNANVKISKISDLADDLSLALSAESIRIIAPIPGRDVVGIETSNHQRETVYLKDLLAEDQFWNDDLKLPIALGKQANGEPKIVDLRKMPHLLVAGTTGSGKSVFTVSTIIGMLFRHSPATLRLILVDPKQVDLVAFSNIPHLIMPPVRDPKKAVSALKWAVREMEKRNKSMSKFGARKLEEYNEIVSKFDSDQIQNHEKINQEYENQGIMKLEQYYYTPQPYLVIIVEEFADLMAVDKINVEQSIIRLAQMARACGIHLMLAMQSPRKEVVTGLIKTNIPGRISFKVASKLDSRVILDEMGAERLLANGDMLFLAPGVGKPARHHGPYLGNDEIDKVAKFWSDQAEPEYDPLAMRALDGFSGGTANNGENLSSGFDSSSLDEEEYDDRYDEILSWATAQKDVSASLIQRKFRLGYPRAARIIEIFEKEGVVGPANGSKPRTVLVKSYVKEAE